MFAKSSETWTFYTFSHPHDARISSGLGDAGLSNKVAVKRCISDDSLRCQVRPLITAVAASTASGGATTLCNFQALVTPTYATFSFYTRSRWGVAMCFWFGRGIQTHENKATNYSAANGNYMCIFALSVCEGKNTHHKLPFFPPPITNIRFAVAL